MFVPSEPTRRHRPPLTAESVGVRAQWISRGGGDQSRERKGLWVATFGLVCVYPHLADDGRWPRGALLAGLGAWVLLTGAIGWTVVRTLTGATGEASGTTLLVLPALVLALLSFLFYGVSSTRTGQPSRTVGYLFLVPFGAVLLLILSFFGTQIADTEFPVVVGVVLFGVLAASIIGLGATLPRDSGGDRSQPG